MKTQYECLASRCARAGALFPRRTCGNAWVNVNELKAQGFNTPSHVYPHGPEGLQVMDRFTRLE